MSLKDPPRALERSREVCALLDSTKYKGQTTRGSNKVAARRGAADLIENMQIKTAREANERRAQKAKLNKEEETPGCNDVLAPCVFVDAASKRRH